MQIKHDPSRSQAYSQGYLLPHIKNLQGFTEITTPLRLPKAGEVTCLSQYREVTASQRE